MPQRTKSRLRLLITAGPTREYLDPVRYLSNASSGRMGLALAAAALHRHHCVTLVHGPLEILPPPGARRISVTSAAQMLAACRKVWPQHDALLMAAAVADYTPARPLHRKRKKSTQPLAIHLKPTVDILATLARQRRGDQVVVGFALEDAHPRAHAAAKLRRKRLDAIVLNSPAAIAALRSRVAVLVAGADWNEWPRMTKTRLAQRLITLVESLIHSRVR